MITVGELSPLRSFVREARAQGRTIGFVPTMGALHGGHLALVRRAREECGFLVVSIFVNPLQFGPGEDFQSYPRDPKRDSRLLESAGVDLLYLPEAREFYPSEFSTYVDVGGVTEGGEGARRPGHFRGVATVVAKLLLQTTPDTAYFGRKDLQQVAVIRRMVRDLDLTVRLVVCETVRERDGLAMSSRNAYLSPKQRQKAAAFPRALRAARDRARGGERDSETLEQRTRRDLEEAGLTVDYVEAVDPSTMRRMPQIDEATVLTAAIRLGKTRLLDNVSLLEE